MKNLLFLLLLALTFSSQAAIYKWVDSRGEVHFSDTPTKGSEEIKLSDPTIYKPAGAAAAPGSAEQKLNSRLPLGANYNSFVIIAPANKEVVHANNGKVSVRFESQPALQPGHYIQPVVDGRILDQRVTGTVLVLENMTRGSHMVHASIHDASGRLLARSNIVEFFVQQRSVIEDGKPPTPPDSGASEQPGGDAPQYTPSAKPDYSGKAAAPSGSNATDFNANPSDSTPGSTNSKFQSTSKPISTTPGQNNPAFKPKY